MPRYGPDGGNTTRTYTRCGRVIDDSRRLKTVLKQLVNYYDADPAALRRNYREYLNCRQEVPLPLCAELILVALKVRRPSFESDGATGYINLAALLNVTQVRQNDPAEKEGVKCFLHLDGGHCLPCHFTPEGVEKRLTQGRLAAYRHSQLHRHRGCTCQSPEECGTALQGVLLPSTLAGYVQTGPEIPVTAVKPVNGLSSKSPELKVIDDIVRVGRYFFERVAERRTPYR